MAKKGQKRKQSPPKGRDMGPELSKIEQLLTLMEKHEIAEFNWKNSGEEIGLRTKMAVLADRSAHTPIFSQMAMPSVQQVLPPHGSGTEATQAEKTGSKSRENSNYKPVKSPFVGTFYRSPSPTSDVFVTE